jgi:hypothetical protein
MLIIFAGTVTMTSVVCWWFGKSRHGYQCRLSSSWPCVHACSGFFGYSVSGPVKYSPRRGFAEYAIAMSAVAPA